jgi:hypothetical protein
MQQTAGWGARTVAGHVKHLADMPVQARRGLAFGRSLDARYLPEIEQRGQLETYFDAHDEGPGLWKWRHYFPVYERHLGRFVGCAPVIVEIGIFSGGSLGMWQSYFGVGTHVHGVDIEGACEAHASDFVSVWIGDQADPGFWERFLAEVPAFDIVIDDGGHEASQQIPTLEALLPRLNPGGVYLCEDIHGEMHAFNSYIDGLSRNLHCQGAPHPAGGHVPTGFQHTVESIHSYPFVTAIEMRENHLERLVAPKHGTQWEPFYGEATSFPDDRPEQAARLAT